MTCEITHTNQVRAAAKISTGCVGVISFTAKYIPDELPTLVHNTTVKISCIESLAPKNISHSDSCYIITVDPFIFKSMWDKTSWFG